MENSFLIFLLLFHLINGIIKLHDSNFSMIYRCYLSDSSDEDYKQIDFNKIGPWEKKQVLKEETSRLKVYFFLIFSLMNTLICTHHFNLHSVFQKEKASLLDKICKECDACIDLRVQIKLLQVNKNH